jgi:hypothetical protein
MYDHAVAALNVVLMQKARAFQAVWKLNESGKKGRIEQRCGLFHELHSG